MTSPPYIFFVGTDTAVGKTALVCELLARACSRGVRALPYKPAQSRDDGVSSDGDRLLAAASLPGLTLDRLVGYDFSIPIAPGMVEDAQRFVADSTADTEPLERCRSQLDASVSSLRPEIVFIEGAGGLWVPMPGGTWQPQWIRALSTAVVIVGRAGLGTINHTLCTIDALRSLGIEPVGFYLSETEPPDRSCASNAQVIVAARGTTYLGTLPHLRRSERCLLTPLLQVCAPSVRC